MGRFFKTLGYEESLFKDERHFDFDYIPKDFNYRDAQLRDIETCLKPALGGGRAINAKIFGSPATGKTTAVKLMFDEVKEKTEKVVCVHINCQIHSSKFTIFSLIHKEVVGHLPPETGVPFPTVYEKIFKKLEKDGKSLVVALDDMNYLFYNRQANEIIYDVLRAHEVFPGAKSAVFGILSETDLEHKLEKRVSSIFKPYEIFFQPYKREEIFSILKTRARDGLHANVISDDMLEKIARHSFEQGDLRVGIELLRKSALMAEAEASRKISKEHVEKAYEGARLANLRHLLDSLSSEEIEVVKLIPSDRKIDSGDLYKLVKQKTGQSYTKFYRILDKLESIRIIDTKFTGSGERGRTRNIMPRYGSAEITNALNQRMR